MPMLCVVPAYQSQAKGGRVKGEKLPSRSRRGKLIGYAKRRVQT
jgi:hypothetical protein